MKVRIIHAENSADGEPLTGSLAPFNTRILAVLIDVVVMIGLQISVSFMLPSRIAWLVGLAYLVTRDSLAFLGGQSIGKKVMKLKVVTADDKSLVNNWEPALIRNGVLAIPLFGFVELVVLLIREDKPERGRRLGDEWAKTKVITVPDPPAA
ncbi:MAG: RDD family protein [Verrucomicrobia bacterium]|nr:RDD family protein [Verrucomicrobiota bacterium]